MSGDVSGGQSVVEQARAVVASTSPAAFGPLTKILAAEVLRLHEPDDALIERVAAARSLHSPVVISSASGYMALCHQTECGWERTYRGYDLDTRQRAARAADKHAVGSILAALRGES